MEQLILDNDWVKFLQRVVSKHKMPYVKEGLQMEHLDSILTSTKHLTTVVNASVELVFAMLWRNGVKAVKCL